MLKTLIQIFCLTSWADVLDDYFAAKVMFEELLPDMVSGTSCSSDAKLDTAESYLYECNHLFASRKRLKSSGTELSCMEGQTSLGVFDDYLSHGHSGWCSTYRYATACCSGHSVS